MTVVLKSILRRFLAKIPVLEGIFRVFVWSRVHFPEDEMQFLNSLPRNSIDIAIDVGAATGSYTWILSRISREVFAFEPGEVHNDYLNRINFTSRIEVIRAAVGNCTKIVNFYTPGTSAKAQYEATVSESNPVVRTEGISVTQVRQIDLDSFFEQRLGEDRSIDLLKVDVEGHEGAVLEGARKLLETHHPMIICEIEVRHNPRYTEVFEFLRRMGYVCYVIVDSELEMFIDNNISEIQHKEDLVARQSAPDDSRCNRYINNFMFFHPESKIRAPQHTSSA